MDVFKSISQILIKLLKSRKATYKHCDYHAYILNFLSINLCDENRDSFLPQVHIQGDTRYISFDTSGKREDYTLSVLSIKAGSRTVRNVRLTSFSKAQFFQLQSVRSVRSVPSVRLTSFSKVQFFQLQSVRSVSSVPSVRLGSVSKTQF